MDRMRKDLVEPEGVNAGSADSTAEGPQTGRGDVRPGGHPDQADAAPDPHERDPIIEAPFAPRDPTAPSLEQSTEEGAH